MFIPLYDDNPLRTIRVAGVNYALILANVLVYFVFQSGLVIDADQLTSVGLGMIPAAFHDLVTIPSNLYLIPEPFTFVTYMFLHGGWMHLIGNMAFLWVFGDNVEDDMGHLRYLGFYLLSGVVAGLVHATANPESQAPLVGASGAIAGVVAAYMILHPRVKVWVLLLMRIPIKISAMWAIGAWIVVQILSIMAGGDDNTAWWAHVGGFAAGCALVFVMRRPGVPLFDRGVAA